MNIKINQHIIKEMCGNVSFKRGDAFYRANKVKLTALDADHCEAVVTGNEDFFVKIRGNKDGSFSTVCSCPKLASYQKECQHTAAVLLAVWNHQRQGTVPQVIEKTPIHNVQTEREDEVTYSAGGDSEDHALTDGLLTIFDAKTNKTPRIRQRHFETRKVLKTSFAFKPVTVGGLQMLGVQLQLGSTPVKDIRETLFQIKEGSKIVLSLSFTYDPALQYFDPEADAVLEQLIQVMLDEKSFIARLEGDYQAAVDTLIIPPSSWEALIKVLPDVPSAVLDLGSSLADFRVIEQELPLEFIFTEKENGSGMLLIKGMQNLLLLDAYNHVITEGNITKLNSGDSEVLGNLKKMLETSGTNSIPVPKEQVRFFFRKVVPGLKKLGSVKILGSTWGEFATTPLVAKLYLDRVKDRLLAGLEFHYGQAVIQPLEARQAPLSSVLLRDDQKERAIMELLNSSDFARTDGGYHLHNEELEYEFLYHTLPKLQELVQVYATTAVRSRIFKASAQPSIRVKVKKERTNWLEFSFELDGIPEKEIKEILAALEEKRKYYRLRNGALLSLEAREYEEIRRFLQAAPIQTEDIEAAFNLPAVEGLRLMDAVEENGLFHQEESFRQFLDSLLHPGKLEFQVPHEMSVILRKYQKDGYRWMKAIAGYGFGGILADDMGLGKTLQSITYLVSVLSEIRKCKMPALIVCPSSLTYNWLAEIRKFAPEIQSSVMDGTQKVRVKRLEEEGLDVIITSYQLLRKDIDWYEKHHFHTVFFDEAQAFKNPVTQTARAVKKVHSDHRFALTGTPVENSLEELWSIFHVVFPELFRGLKEYSKLTRQQISRRISPFLLRRLKEDVLAELPEKLETLHYSEMLPEQKKLYAAYLAKLRHDTLKHLNKDTLRKNRIKILAGLTRLRQICCHPALFVDGYKGGSSKHKQLMQIIEDSQQAGRRVLIFSQFTRMLEIIGRDLASQGYDFFYLDGQTAPEERVEICDRFNKGVCNLFLISLKAGGTGLNLTGADTVILYDLWWNPAVEEQAADRAHRIGQTNEVQVIKLVARGTIEEKMNELQEKKRNMIQEIIDPGEKVSQALTEEDIREILKI